MRDEKSSRLPLEMRLKNIVDTEPAEDLLKAFHAFTGSDEENRQTTEKSEKQSLVDKKIIDHDQDNSAS